jgi:hypothetical protein
MSYPPRSPQPVPHTQWNGGIEDAAGIIDTVIEDGGDADIQIRKGHLDTVPVIRVKTSAGYDFLHEGDWLVRDGEHWRVWTDAKTRAFHSLQESGDVN